MKGTSSAAARGKSVSESYPDVDVAVPSAREAVTRLAARAGLNGEPLDDVRLAVSEAVSNAVRHAHRGRQGHVLVNAYVASGELWVLVADRGCGLQTPAEDPGLGLGLALMAEACDDFVVAERTEGGTEARMGFRTAEDEAAS